MARIKDPAITLAPSYKVPGIGVAQKGVTKAPPPRVIPSGKRILAQAVGELGKSVGDMAVYLAKKEELLRQTASEEIQMDIADEFVERLRHAKNQKGTQAKGLLDDEGWHYGALEDLKTKYMSEDLDARTTSEVKKFLNNQILQERKMLISHTLTQADVADKQIAKRRLDNAFSYVNELDINDPEYIHDIEKQALELTTAHILRRPEMNREQVGKAYKEELLYHGMIKSFMEQPIMATKLWEENEKYFEKSLPTKYDNLATKYKTAKDNARYDIADAELRLKHDNNYAAMAEDVEKNYKEYDLYADDALELGAKYRGIHNFGYTEEQRNKTKIEDETLSQLDQDYRDPETGLMNLQPYLSGVEQAYRYGEIDKTTRDYVRNQAMTGELSNEDYLRILDDIHGGRITTKPQINRELAGRSTGKLATLYGQLDKVQTDDLKGLTENQLNAAEQTFLRLAQEEINDQRTGGIKLDKSDANNFKNHLRAWAIQQGYSSRDPRIHDEAIRLLQKGWYYKYPSGVEYDEPFVEGEPGMRVILKGLLWTGGPERVHRWEYEAEHGEPEGKETATSGTPKLDPKVKESIDFLRKVYPESDELNMENIQWGIKELEKQKRKQEELTSGVSK